MIKFCPHCCNRAKQELIHEQPYLGLSWGVDDGDEGETEEKYYVYKCSTCSEILVYHELFNFGLTLVYPDVKLDESVPERISKIYDEAVRIKRLAPNSFAVQIRRALEAVCLDRGTTKRNLVANLKELNARGEIPAVLSEASDILRLIGNIGAHASDIDVHPMQASAIDDFFIAIVEYVYISPAKIERFKGMLKNYGNFKNEEPSNSVDR